MARRPTQSDIARRAGVSRSAVAKALNLPADRCELSGDTRGRILATARQLGYRAAAQAPVRLATGDPEGWKDPFLPAFLAAADAAGIRLLLGADDRPAATVSVAFPTPATAGPRFGLNCRAPGLCAASPDEAADMAVVVAHLASLGHRRLVFAFATGVHAHDSVERRRAAFQTACRAHACQGAEAVLNHGDGDLRRELADVRGPSALVLAPIESQPWDFLELRRRRPFALVVIGNNLRGGSATSLQPDYAGVADGLVERLRAVLAGAAMPGDDLLLPGRLVVRDTSVPPP
jgi:DNA-binding LacI/PurR family transcriptional regulator